MHWIRARTPYLEDVPLTPPIVAFPGEGTPAFCSGWFHPALTLLFNLTVVCFQALFEEYAIELPWLAKAQLLHRNALVIIFRKAF